MMSLVMMQEIPKKGRFSRLPTMRADKIREGCLPLLSPRGEIGKHKGLKIPRPKGLASSILAVGIFPTVLEACK